MPKSLLIILFSLFCTVSYLTDKCHGASIQINRSNLKRFLFGGNDVKELPELDWNTIKHETLDIKTKEIEMTPKQLYAKIEECVKKCQKIVNSNITSRDQCIAKTCDIY
jgi:hypothetical protein